MRNEHSPAPEQAVTPLPRAVRWTWIAWCALAVGWYFFGYVRSLDALPAPLYRALPFLEQLIGKGVPWP